MFTLKFVNLYENGGHNETVIHSPHYNIYERPNGLVTVTVHKSIDMDSDGRSFYICHPSKQEDFACDLMTCFYDCCYIENESGKTINVIRPKELKL